MPIRLFACAKVSGENMGLRGESTFQGRSSEAVGLAFEGGNTHPLRLERCPNRMIHRAAETPTALTMAFLWSANLLRAGAMIDSVWVGGGGGLENHCRRRRGVKVRFDQGRDETARTFLLAVVCYSAKERSS